MSSWHLQIAATDVLVNNGIGQFALLITAAAGAIGSFAAFIRSRRELRTKADQSAIAGWTALIDGLRQEVAIVRKHSYEQENRIGELRAQNEACERRADNLQEQLHELERRHARGEL